MCFAALHIRSIGAASSGHRILSGKIQAAEGCLVVEGSGCTLLLGLLFRSDVAAHITVVY